MSETGSYNYFDLRHVDTAMMSRCTMCRMRKCMTLVSPSGSPPCLIHQMFSAVLPSPQWYFYKRHTCRQQSTMLAPAPKHVQHGTVMGGWGMKASKRLHQFSPGLSPCFRSKSWRRQNNVNDFERVQDESSVVVQHFEGEEKTCVFLTVDS